MVRKEGRPRRCSRQAREYGKNDGATRYRGDGLRGIVRFRALRFAWDMIALIGWLGVGVTHGLAATEADWRYVSIPFTQSNGPTLQLWALEVVPAGNKRFPLAVISHGTPRKDSERPRMAPMGFRAVATWFADQGFAVVVPMRRGYGQSDGPWVESIGTCQPSDYERAGLDSAADIAAVTWYMRGQSFVDPQRIVLVGHSAGAWGSVAAASQNLSGVRAVVAFAPGRGSYAPDAVCNEPALAKAAHSFGATVHVPSLWIYSVNDHFFGPTLARRIFDAFHDSAAAPTTFLTEPACSQDGHMLIFRCPNDWHDAVAAFLQRTMGTK